MEYFFVLLLIYLLYISLKWMYLEEFGYKNQFRDGYVTKEEYDEQIKTINKINKRKVKIEEQEKKNTPYDTIT